MIRSVGLRHNINACAQLGHCFEVFLLYSGILQLVQSPISSPVLVDRRHQARHRSQHSVVVSSRKPRSTRDDGPGPPFPAALCLQKHGYGGLHFCSLVIYAVIMPNLDISKRAVRASSWESSSGPRERSQVALMRWKRIARKTGFATDTPSIHAAPGIL